MIAITAQLAYDVVTCTAIVSTASDEGIESARFDPGRSQEDFEP